MPFISDLIFDNGLAYAQANVARLDICSTEPTTYTQATSTNTLGNKTLVAGSPANGATDGRRVIIPAITDGAVTATGTAAFYAVTDGVNVLLATGPLSAGLPVTSGKAFTLDAISVTIRDAA
jgi:hypothetical protein